MKTAILFFVSGLLALLFGVFVITQPATVVNIAALCFSIVLTIKGIKTLFDTLTFKKNAINVVVNGEHIDLGIQKKIRLTLFWDGLISLVLGLVALIIAIYSFANKSAGIMKGVVYVIAAGFLFTGIANIIEGYRLKPYPILADSYKSGSLVYIIAAVLLFAFPFFIGNTVMNIFGILLIVAGVLLFCWGIRLLVIRKRLKATTVSFDEVK